jgi:hypothetical protein
MLTITDQTIKAEYLDKHLPYRINSMLAHDLIMHRKTQQHFASIKDNCYGDSAVVEPIFEISLIFGRSLLNFLGLHKENSNDRIIEFSAKRDDLTIKSLFPTRGYCPLNEQLVVDNYDALCKIVKLANKSVAHLTSVVTETLPQEHDILPQARITIYKLMLKYVPEMNRQNIWWFTQVENNQP